MELELDYRDLADYYPEFQLDDKCRYLDCSHVKEGKDCEVYIRVLTGDINKSRYDRYADLYLKLKEKWEKKYD